ncbi:MAG: 4Fe-4S binding protein [Candidatus Omnitrophica bacterium]|nr:4Fe-4S binding protein [Candidatus Omnitrophota bacterium]
MRIYGLELIRGLGITLWHFVASYTVGIRRTFAHRVRTQVRQRPSENGVFTVQYPEERLAVPERFRVLPVLIFDGKENEKWKQATERCTACGICAKVCPPQCIWIVQGKSPEGKPIPKASEFYIDVDVCMNCGLCAEFCPFDAIKMDQTFELGSDERRASHIFDIDKLHVSTDYYARTHPKAWAEEEAKRKAEADKKAAAAAAGKAQG